MRRSITIALLHVAKAVGLFRFTRWLTRSELRILCYHGVSAEDEHEWEPVTFMKPDTLRQRLTRMQELEYPILALALAMTRLREGTLPQGAVAITFDDGFHSVLSHGLPLFRELGVPVTLYVTTYYVDKPTPIFRLALQYGAWKANKLGRQVPTSKKLWEQIDAAERLSSELERSAIAADVLATMGLDWNEMARNRFLALMSRDELRYISEAGVDLQLHTHRHSLPVDPDGVRREIGQNRSVLEPIVGHELDHFCYPSGVWSPMHLPVLRELRIQSATTCDIGLNDAREDPLTLRRFLDSESKRLIEFEAELSGFKEVVKRCLAFRRPAPPASPADRLT